MSDILRQVDEDLRKEKLSNLFKKYGLYVIITLAIIIGSVIGYQVMVSIDKSKNEKSSEDNSNDENFDFNLSKISNEISSDKEYGNLTSKDIHEKIQIVLKAMLKDNGLEVKQFNEYQKSLKKA